MKIKELKIDEAKKNFLEIESEDINNSFFDSLDQDYSKIRKDILSFVPRIEKNYQFDLAFAIKIFEYFNAKNFIFFNEHTASNYNFWRYICLKVVPDIIIKRHGLKEEYFYSKNVRIYLPTLWWFIKMCWQGNADATRECLKDFSTDIILQIVERPGRDGMFLEVSRIMIKYLSKIDGKIRNEKKGGQTLIRRLLIQHTARNNNFNLVVEGKTEEYVKGLFSSCGVEVE